MEWQPIETAPSDTIILLAGVMDHPTDWRIKVGYNSVEMGMWRIWGASWKPLRWQPLPPPPMESLPQQEREGVMACPEPPPECETEAEKRAFAFGWWKAMEAKRTAGVSGGQHQTFRTPDADGSSLDAIRNDTEKKE